MFKKKCDVSGVGDEWVVDDTQRVLIDDKQVSLDVFHSQIFSKEKRQSNIDRYDPEKLSTTAADW